MTRKGYRKAEPVKVLVTFPVVRNDLMEFDAKYTKGHRGENIARLIHEEVLRLRRKAKAESQAESQIEDHMEGLD